MKIRIAGIVGLCTINFMLFACKKPATPPVVKDTGLVNTSHLDYLYIPVTFSTGTKAAGVFIYADAPDYHLVEATGEGFTCIDDVARATLVYLRSNKFSTDTAVQEKAFNLIRFIVEMQSPNGYFYNFLYSNSLINKFGATSIDNANWWSWRALQALTEGELLVKNKDAVLYNKMDVAINKLVTNIKRDFVNLPATTGTVNGITVPQWLPEGSGTDQSALLIVGLIPYCTATNDVVIKDFIKKLADGIVLMQQGDATNAPYGCFLSWENTWHAYGNLQAYALLQAGAFLNDAQYTTKAMAEIDNFYPWLLQNGFKSSFELSKSGSVYQTLNDKSFDQIAYGISPMVFAATEAYKITGDNKYADIAGHLAAWFLGANAAAANMYDITTGRCYDGISSASNVNHNSGAESTIEALLTMEKVESDAAVKTAMNKYKK
jgi:hypothetical protein